MTPEQPDPELVVFGADHEHLPILKTLVEYFDIRAGLTLKKGDPRAGVRSNHRSAFSSADVREKRTLPRSPRSFA